MIKGRIKMGERGRKREEGKNGINEGKEGGKEEDIFICLSARQNKKRIATMEKNMGPLGIGDSTKESKKGSSLFPSCFLPSSIVM